MSPHALLSQLADGRFHSGEALAATFNVTRAAVWKQLRVVRQLPGVTVHAVRGRGYRLAQPLELLQEEQLRAGLSGVADRLHRLEILPATPSTNAHLMAAAPPPPAMAHVCLAEHQTAGRGRRGRPWLSGYARNLTLSLAWTFDLPMARLAGLSLAVGVAIARALSALGVEGVGLKWPNDVYLHNAKLAGLLVEASGEANGPTRVVIGVGMNLMLSDDTRAGIDQPCADLSSQLGATPPRNAIAARLLVAMIDALPVYAEQGLRPFLDDWSAYDVFRGRTVQVQHGDQCIVGQYRGIADDGLLQLATADGLRAFAGGEVSLRPAAS